MKKIISVIICALVVLQFYITMVQESNQEVREMAGLEMQYCAYFSIPESDMMQDAELLFQVLKDTAQETNTNLVRSLLVSREDGSLELLKFILLTTESGYMGHFPLKSGDWFSIEQTQDGQEQAFLSSQVTEKEEQQGILDSHIQEFDLTLRTLNQQADYFKESGLYYVELNDAVTKEAFIGVLKENLEQAFHIELDAADLEGQNSNVGLPYMDIGTLILLRYIGIVLMVLCMVYHCFREEKQSAVLNLFGIGHWRAVFWTQKSLYGLCLAACGVGFFGFCIWTGDVWYTLQLLKSSIGVVFLICVLLYIVGILFQNQEQILVFLKGKKTTGGIYWMTVLAKLACILAVLYVGEDIYQSCHEYLQLKESYAGWEKAESFGVFYPLYTGYETTEKERLLMEYTMGTALYEKLNADGAIFMDARLYEEEALRLDGMLAFPYVRANPNYLSQYPLLDENGQIIAIEETETENVLLVPIQYKDREQELIAKFQQDHEGSIWADETWYETVVPELVKSNHVKVIWIRDGQNVFTLNEQVRVGEGNAITDSIVQVITLHNSCVSDRIGILGSAGQDFIKIRLHGDGVATMQWWAETLEELGLDDNLKHVISCNEQAMETMNQEKAAVLLAIRVLAVIGAVFVLICEQNIAILFDRNRKNFMIKRMHGWNWWSVYGKQLLLQVFFVLIMVVVYGAAAPYEMRHWRYLVEAAVLMALIESLLLLHGTIRLEKKKVIETLKGE